MLNVDLFILISCLNQDYIDCQRGDLKSFKSISHLDVKHELFLYWIIVLDLPKDIKQAVAAQCTTTAPFFSSMSIFQKQIVVQNKKFRFSTKQHLRNFEDRHDVESNSLMTFEEIFLFCT